MTAPLATVASLLFAAHAGTAPSPEKPYTRNVAVVVHDGMEILDFAGPAEVFAAAAGFGASPGGRAFRVYTVGRNKQPITSQGFIRVTPEFSIEDAPKPDLLVIPGGGSQVLTDDPRFMAWVSSVTGSTEISVTVCTGAFVLAKAGRLDGRDVTTFYNAIPGLREAAPAARVHDGRRFIDSGTVVTTAGVSAGIDGALHVVARLLGRYVADRTAEYMEYHWTPEPYLAKGYALLNPSLDEAGRRLQQASILEDEGKPAEAAKAYRAIVAASPDAAFAWYRLGAALQGTGDLDGAIEAAGRASQDPVLRPSALYNLACAYALQGKTDDAIGAVERAVAAGFKSKGLLLSDADLASIRDDARFKRLAASL